MRLSKVVATDRESSTSSRCKGGYGVQSFAVSGPGLRAETLQLLLPLPVVCGQG